MVAGYASWHGFDTRYHGHAPVIGEHTREILSEAGIDNAHIDELLASGAVTETKP